MEIEKLEIEGLIVIKPKVFGDERGFFMETYSTQAFKDAGIDINWVQDNHSRSQKNVFRGLHYQKEPMAQDKLVRVTRGAVLDVAVDLRKDSPTFGKYAVVELSEENKNMFLIPKGFAHGFICLTDDVDFQYKVSNPYSPENDRGVRWNDPDIGFAKELEERGITDPVISEKDSKQPYLKDIPEEDLF